MRRALLVAFHYPPATAIGARRAVRFAKHLPAHGYEVAVLAADPGSEVGCRVDPAARGPDGVPVYHAPASDRVKTLRARIGGRGAADRRGSTPLPSASTDGGGGEAARSSAARSLLSPLTQGFKDVVTDLLRLPDASAGWLRPAREAARRAIAERRPDVVIATAPPWTALVVGALAARDAGVPFVADLRDPWVGNPYSRPVTRVGRALAPLVERWCLRQAGIVIANTGRLREHVLGRYPDMAERVIVVPNGPDDERSPATGAGSGAAPGYDGARGEGPLKVVHTGTLYGGRDPRVIFAAVKRLLDRGEIRPDELAIDLVGPLEVPGIDTAAVRADTLGIVEFVPPVSQAEAQRIARAADVLLLFQPGAPLQLPAKVFEYLGAGREVLTIAGPGATADFARSEALGPVAGPDAPEEIAAALLELVRRKRAGQLRRPVAEAIERYRPERLAGQLARAIDGLLGAPAQLPAAEEPPRALAA
ncbi:MAG TPA: glycosyltransferase family 4 protein [Planctomycetota bacterium]|nr:glycosyltransferase family 4 protein [Planctomycetota bacterium]